MKYHTLFFRKLEKISQSVLSAAVVIGALRANIINRENEISFPYVYFNICEKVCFICIFIIRFIILY